MWPDQQQTRNLLDRAKTGDSAAVDDLLDRHREALRRAIALRSSARAGLTTGEMEAERIAELEQRVADLEAGQAHVADLAERLDFAERLLAQSPPALKVMGPQDDQR